MNLIAAVVQLLTHVWLFATSWTIAWQASLSFTISQSLHKLRSIEAVMPYNHLIICHPLLLLPSIFPSIRVFLSESVLHIRRPKYWSFSLRISPSLWRDWFPLGLTGLISLQSKGLSRVFSNTTVPKHPQCSNFCIIQLSHPYMTTCKNIALTKWTFVSKVMSLLFNMMSRLVITFLPRNVSSHFIAAVIICSDFGAPKNKVSYCFHCFPIYLPWSDGLDSMILVFRMLSFKPNFSLYSFTFIKRLFSSSLSAIRVVSSAYLRLLIFLLAILIPACASSSLAFLMMYSAYKLNKQGDNIQPWRTPCLIWNQSVVPCPVLTVASWPAYRFLKSQVRWSGVPISFRIFHSLMWKIKGFPHSQRL